MNSLKLVQYKLKFVDIRFYGLKYGPSFIGYKQMPDAFYNIKRKNLPPKIFTAIAKPKWSVSDYFTIKLMNFQYKYDLTFPNLLGKLQSRYLQNIRKQQLIPSEAIEELGVNLAVAHLIIHLGGAVRMVGSDHWIGHVKDSNNLLPKNRVRDFHIEAIDLSGTLITYEGLEYLPSLTKLKELKLNTSSFLDDHCLRRISRMRKKLEYLDISNCPQISGKGLATLWSLKGLKRLNLANNPFLEDKELVSILLIEKNPALQIQGVDYLASLNSKQKERVLQLFHNQKESEQLTDDNKENDETEQAVNDNKRQNSE